MPRKGSHNQSSPKPVRVNIAAFFEAEEKRHRDLTEKREGERRALQAKLDAAGASIEQLAKDSTKKTLLLIQNRAEGLDTKKLTARIGKLDAEIAAESAKQESLKREIDELAKVSQKSFQREREMARFLAEKQGCTDAIEIDGLGGCYPFLATELVKCDDAGRPRMLRVYAGAHVSKEVAIQNGDSRYWRHFRPKSLEWLLEPKQAATLNGQDHPGFLAFIDRSTQRLLLSTTQFEWRVEGSSDYRGNVQYVTKNEDFTQLAASLKTHMEESLDKVNGEIDLQRAYSDNEFAEYLRSRVLELTPAEPQFKPCAEQLASTAIYSRIKADWDAFVACPWTDDVKGTLALLKYHSENGEKPRFWSGQFEGQYGFRLRTRDHSWIVGQVYIEKSDQVPSATSVMAIREAGYSAHIVATLGRFHLAVEARSHED